MDVERIAVAPPHHTLEAAATVYGRAFAEAPYGEGPRQAGEFVERVLRYAARPGFRLTLCRDGLAVIGIALSVHARAGDWWRDRVAESLGPELAAQWLEPVAREVVHVAVDPAARRHGVGRLLTEDALDDTEATSVVLSCHPDAGAAQLLYRACGFQTLSEDFRTAPGQLGYLLMARAPGAAAGRGTRRPLPASSFRTKPTLTGERVVLRPVAEADAEGLAACDPETLRLTGSHKTVEMDELRTWYRTRADHDDRIDLSIVERATGRWVGEAVLNELDTHNRACGFRILIAREHDYGRGFGTEATRLVLAYAFGQAGVHRVELEVYAFNRRARHVYEKVGFVLEGTKRDALRWDGEWVDAHLMAMLAADWRRASAATA